MGQRTVRDHLQRTVTFPFPPRRIISLCPSMTETLFALHLEGQVAGRTRYCIHPADGVRNVPVVGGTKQVDHEAVDRIYPDLIVAEKEENPKEMVEALAAKYPVYVANVESYGEALKMIADLGVITGREDQAEALVRAIGEEFRTLADAQGLRVAYVIWRKPYMVAGGRTFINSMLERCGFRNVFAGRPDRYPVVQPEDFRQASPDVVLLSSEPFPFAEKHIGEFRQFLPQSRIILADGAFFSWYGFRMLLAPAYLNRLLASLLPS